MLDLNLNQEKLKLFKLCIDTVESFFNGPQKFLFTSQSMQFQGMDQGSVFVYFDIKKEFFSGYKIENDILELRLNIGDFKKILARPVSENEILKMNFNDSNRLQLFFIKDISQQKRKYELALHNPDDTDDKRDLFEVINGIPLAISMNCKPGLIKKVLGDVAVATEKDQKHLAINGNQDLITFSVIKGSEGLNAFVELPTNEPEEYEIESEEPIWDVAVNYDMEYIDKAVSKLDLFTDKTKVEIGSDKPIRITFKLTPEITFVLVMAPLVEEDEDAVSDESDTTEYGAPEGQEE